MNRMNSGVRIVRAPLTATSDRSTSPEVKKNVRSRLIGPPAPHENSVRPKSGWLNPAACFWK